MARRRSSAHQADPPNRGLASATRCPLKATATCKKALSSGASLDAADALLGEDRGTHGRPHLKSRVEPHQAEGGPTAPAQTCRPPLVRLPAQARRAPWRGLRSVLLLLVQSVGTAHDCSSPTCGSSRGEWALEGRLPEGRSFALFLPDANGIPGGAHRCQRLSPVRKTSPRHGNDRHRL
jgi:hypothetical protein